MWNRPEILKFRILSQLRHLNRSNRSFSAFIAVFSTTSVHCLLTVIIGKYTKDHRNVILYIQVFDSLRYGFTHVIEVLGFTLDHASYGNNGI